jgi:hypothetical protein
MIGPAGIIFSAGLFRAELEGSTELQWAARQYLIETMMDFDLDTIAAFMHQICVLADDPLTPPMTATELLGG